MNISNRLKKLRASLVDKELDGILISQPQNRYYLSGFSGSAGYLLITAGDTILATDFRYVEQVKEQAPDYTLFQIAGSVSTWFPQLVDGTGIKKLGFESTDITHSMYRQLAEALKQVESTCEHLGCQLPERGNVVQYIEPAAKRGDDEIVVPDPQV